MGYLGMGMLLKVLFVYAVSFFVLLGVTKTESGGLKQLGRIVAMGLCIIATYIVIVTVYCSVASMVSPKESSVCKYIAKKQSSHGKYKSGCGKYSHKSYRK